MSKVYEALTITEAQRSARNAAEPTATAAGLAIHSPSGGELEKIRAILVGNLPDMIAEALERLSVRITEQSATFRSDLDGLERKLNARITEIEARSNCGRNDLRDQILSQSKLLTDSIQERSEHAIEVSMKGVMELREAKLDRRSFADFLRHTSEHFARSASGGDGCKGESRADAEA
jgi:hypothetical protein